MDDMEKDWKMWIIAILILIGVFLFAHFVTPDALPLPGN
jgi:hypothetical protein